MPRPALQDALVRFLQRPELGALPRVLVVACSGGADSVALLRAAVAEAPALGWHVEALHCDHGLRREAEADSAFVAALCAVLGLRLHAFSRRVGKGPGLEARARAWRQRCYAQAAEACGARLVLLAHHAQDQAETVLLNLVRGAGPLGAAGIRALSPLQGAAPILLGRPFLGLMPEQLRQALRQARQAWREDASNRDTTLARNRVRHEILPQLRALNLKAVQHLAAFASAVAPEGADLAGLLKLDRAARARASSAREGPWSR